MAYEFNITMESESLALARNLDACVLLSIDCEAEVAYDGPSDSMIDGVTILKIFDESENEIKLESLSPEEQAKIQKLADAYADEKLSDWVEDIIADAGDRAYDEWKDRQMEEGE